MATQLKSRDIIPIAPSIERYRAPLVRFGLPDIVCALSASAAIVGTFFAWVSLGAAPGKAALDLPFMFLFRGFEAGDSSISVGLAVAAAGVVGLSATRALDSPWARGLIGLCGFLIVCAAIAMAVQVARADPALLGQSAFKAFGIGAWISGGAGVFMVATPLVSRFD